MFAQLFFSFACRSNRYTLPQLGVFTNPCLFASITISGILQISLLWFPLTRSVFFKTAPQFGFDWLAIFLPALVPVWRSPNYSRSICEEYDDGRASMTKSVRF
jgi:P-type Ca2+ transporter type 2C